MNYYDTEQKKKKITYTMQYVIKYYNKKKKNRIGFPL